jgi:plasmid stabilization system protein ParE
LLFPWLINDPPSLAFLQLRLRKLTDTDHNLGVIAVFAERIAPVLERRVARHEAAQFYAVDALRGLTVRFGRGTDGNSGCCSEQASQEDRMPRGDKSKYTDKQARKADHIAEGYEKRGVSDQEAERRAWATVNKEDGGGKKSGSGRGKPEDHAPSAKGGRRSQTSRTFAERSAAAKKGAAVRKRKAEQHAGR